MRRSRCPLEPNKALPTPLPHPVLLLCLAARMESHGKKGKIHVSEATAALIQEAGKPEWIAQRSDQIEAKGKGVMQTYWVNVPI